MPRVRDDEEKSITLVLIPHHGASLFQWRLPRWAWYGLLLACLSLLGSAAWVLGQHIRYHVELSRLEAERDTNKKVALELSKGRDAIVRVAQLELELRRMLRFKSEKALLSADSVGGPSEEDEKNLAKLLEAEDASAGDKAETDMNALMAAAREREKTYAQLKDYVDKKRSLLASKPTAWPVHGWISSGFGSRVSPLSGEKGFHTGVDIANDFGSPIRATADGRVAYAGWEGGYGKLVVINHSHGYQTYYGHLSEIKVAQGQMIRRGTIVGLMGQTGDATGPHVHYEVRVYSVPVDPTKYMQ